MDDPLKTFLRQADEALLPNMKNSALCLSIFGKPDAKLCLEIGAAILFDKPIILLVPDGEPIPANLKRCAAAIIEGDVKAPRTQERIRDALSSVLHNDRRIAPAGVIAE